MTPVLVTVLVVSAYLVGLGVGEPLGVPSSDLVLPVVVAVGLGRGSSSGAVAGFGAGLLIDLAPGSTYPVGSAALAGTLVGYLAGLLSNGRGDRLPVVSYGSGWRRGVVAAAITAGALLVQALVHVGLGAVIDGGLSPPSPVGSTLGMILVAGVLVPPLTGLLFGRSPRG